MIAAIIESALAFVPLHVESAEHRRECDCDVCVHRAVATEPHPWCVFCGSSDDVHREPRTLIFRGRRFFGRAARPHAALCQSCWCATVTA